MKKTSLLFFLIFLLSCPNIRLHAEDITPILPKLVVKAPHFNFDPVKQGETVTHNFVLKNGGNADLEIFRIIPGCGCTVTALSKKKLAPGEETKLKVDFHTDGFIGKKIRTISLETSDPKMKVFVLTMEGIIESDVILDPKKIDFGPIQKGQSASRELKITIAKGVKTKISSIFSKSHSLEISKISQTDLQSTYKIFLKDDVKAGDFRALISIGLNDKNRPALTVPVFATVVGKNG
ncbi:MAG: DUF1573 domain-containing protein [bacterium]|nr:DUF1573 domain-containing protein [bacterium]